MAERDSWAVMDGSTRKVDAEDARLAITALLTTGATSVRGRQGLRPGPGNPGLVTASGTPDINVKVEKFQAIVTATRGLGEYVATLDADKTINVLGDNPAHGTQQRNHLIIALQTDTYYADGTSKFEVIEVIGVAGAGDPSLAAFSDYILLARLRITAGAATVTSAMIDDLRPTWFVALGGLLPVKDQTERDALTAWDGLQIYRRDRNWREIHDGGAWRVQDVAVCSSTADRDSAITNPVNGQLAVTTDTYTVWLRKSGAWVDYAAKGVIKYARRDTSSSQSSSTTALGVLRLDSISVIAGRAYVFNVTCHPNSTVQTDNARVEVRGSTTGNATTSDTVLPSGQFFHKMGTAMTFRFLYIAGATATLSALLCVARDAGTGAVDLIANGTTRNTEFWVEEMVPVTDTGVDM